MDAVFIIVVIAIWAVTHWLIRAVVAHRRCRMSGMYLLGALLALGLLVYLLYALIKPEKF